MSRESEPSLKFDISLRDSSSTVSSSSSRYGGAKPNMTASSSLDSTRMQASDQGDMLASHQEEVEDEEGVDWPVVRDEDSSTLSESPRNQPVKLADNSSKVTPSSTPPRPQTAPTTTRVRVETCALYGIGWFDLLHRHGGIQCCIRSPDSI